ncbi:MAG: amino acid ABC transporter permease [Proteobacteria bacterium]|nr:amino acid ABC transporter permease [Pseudomonadota bacterium]MDA1057099.1 amino acid ABC transporter permease [Pseudomonadota bacterium]
MTTSPFFRQPNDMLPERAPPVAMSGIIGWLRANLFSGWLNTGLTLLALYALWLIIPGLLNWAFFDADFAGTDRFACTGTGACWAWFDQRIDQFLYGFYPDEQTWRVNLALFLILPALAPILFDKMPGAKQLRWFSLAFPFVATFLLIGGFGLEEVPTNKFGGFMLNVTVGLAGIVLSLPIGIVLALGRRSKMPIVRTLSVAFIEVFRGVPLITLLFVAAILLPIFLPSSFSLDLVVRVIVVVTAFASAYMAEVIRGGLQAIPRGQYEAAQALGLGYWRMMGLIILPQALKISIPGIVNTFIGLFKDTTLVIVIGLFDVLNIGRTMISNPDWLGLAVETQVFISLFFFVVCFSMSRYSVYLEQRLDTSKH